MKTNNYGRFSTFALLTAALAVGAQAQTTAPPTKAPTAPTSPKVTPAAPASTLAKPAGVTTGPVVVTAHPAATPKKPGQEGLTMHGHWTIDLRNADGTIAEHRDFENALLTPQDLLYLVTGQYVTGDLGITIASSGSYVCAAGGSSTALGGCLVAASSTAGLGGISCAGTAAGFCNYTLKEVTNGGGGDGAITLSGTMPVMSSGAVQQVGTQILECNSGGTGTFSSIDPVGCYNGTEGGGYFYGNLTGTSITPLNVTAGQTIAFTVVLTFS